MKFCGGFVYEGKTDFHSVFSGGRGLFQRKLIALNSPLPPEGSERYATVARQANEEIVF